ncbi:MAG TPA: carboxypeptidase regulatory-like domain-containing protein, partial [Bryobacteraceae bacterium]
SRFPNVATYERTVPSDLIRLGVIQVPNASNVYVPYNLNPVPVTYNGVTYGPSSCGTGLCDPRGIGLNPIVNQIWSKQMPRANEFLNQGDLYNTQGFLSTIRAPLTTNGYVGRIDHDFGERNRLFASYRFTRLINLTTNQVDIGGVLPGNTFGQPAAVAPRPQIPSIWVIGLTTNVKPTVTNDFRANYTRSYWQWGSANAPPQLPGLGGAVEIGGESTNALIPYNVNTQSVRQRFWDGQDKLLRDDLTWIKGNHLVQFGGSYQRNYDYHMRSDNGQGISNQIVYQVSNSGINFGNFAYPGTVPSNQQSTWNSLMAQVLGMVNQPQVAYTRSGSSLALQPVGAFAFEKSVIPYYDLYWSDTWHMTKSLTLTYGLSYGLEMPPYELNGNQVSLVNQDGTIVDTQNYLNQRKAAALAGTVYEPTLGFALTPNTAGHPKYPYNPFYGGWSPRVSAAWNPSYSDGILGKLFGNGKTVLRGGYSQIWGRINGVNQVLVPLLGPGLLQAVACNGPTRTGTCAGSNNVDPSTVFRIGTDGMAAPLPAVPASFPQPYFPGIQGAPANDATVLDPQYKPQRTENFSFTLQRQLSSKTTLEVGYVGRQIRNEYRELNLDAVPYMTTLGGQTFAQAWANTYWPVNNAASSTGFTLPAQPFFEAALGGANSASCQGFANCTSMLASTATFRNAIRNGAVSDFWSAMYKLPSWTLPRSMISQNLPTSQTGGLTQSQGTAYNEVTSLGYGNYNALFVSFRTRDWKGITTTSNFTWGRSLGTGTLAQLNSSDTAMDAWNPEAAYGPQSFDIKFIYNAAIFWQSSSVFRQRGIVGRLLGGWVVSPLLTAQSGGGQYVGYSEGSCSECQAFGEATPPASTTSTSESAVAAAPYTGGNSAHYNVIPASGGVGTNNPTGVNMFSDPASVLAEFRKCVLGFDTRCGGGYYTLRGFPRWNVDAAVSKDIGLWKEGRVGATFNVQITNVFNHVIMNNPTMTITSPTTFGRTTSVATGTGPRNMEFGVRIHF